MQIVTSFAAFALAAGSLAAVAQQTGQPTLKVDSTNRTLAVQAGAQVTAAADLAVLHVGFETQLGDAQQVYAEGSRTSNAIVAALKAAGIAASEIQSESQRIGHDWDKPRKFKLTEYWTVRVPVERAAEILDVAIQAGATSSGEIEWTLKDRKALDEKVLHEATERVVENARVLARGMGAKLGALLYVTNEMPVRESVPVRMRSMAMAFKSTPAEPLAIEPAKITSETSVYAVFALE